MKYLLCIIFGGILTIALNFFSTSTKDLEALSKKEKKVTIQEEVKSCSIDCSRFTELEKHEKKYLENKEFIPKAILAYLAAVGFKIGDENTKEINKILKNPKRYTTKKLKKLTSPGEELDTQMTFFKKDLVADKYVVKETLNGLFTIRPADSEFIEITNNSKFIKGNKNFKKINGSYEGFLKLHNDRRINKRLKIVYMEIEFEQKSKGHLEGEYKVEIENYKSRSGNGVNRIVLLDVKTGMVSVKVSADSFFIFPSLEMLNRGVLDGWYFKNKKVRGLISLMKTKK